jgi:urease accessory protein
MTTTITTTTRSSHAGALRLRVEQRTGRSALVGAQGHVPYAARVVPARPGWVRVVLVQTIAGPLAGDRTTIEVDVGPGAALELVGNAATLALPCAEPARHEVRVRLAAGARLAWLPQPLIVAAGCDLDASLELELAEGAAALTRELVVLGRHGELPGRYRSRLRCELEGRLLLHDEVQLSEQASTASAAVLDGASAFGSLALLGLRPARSADPEELELAGPGRVVRALAPEAATLRARLAGAESAWLDDLRSPVPGRRATAGGEPETGVPSEAPARAAC